MAIPNMIVAQSANRTNIEAGTLEPIGTSDLGFCESCLSESNDDLLIRVRLPQSDFAYADMGIAPAA